MPAGDFSIACAALTLFGGRTQVSLHKQEARLRASRYRCQSVRYGDEWRGLCSTAGNYPHVRYAET